MRRVKDELVSASARVQALRQRGVQVIDPAQVTVAAAVVPERIAPGAILFPGTRLHGARTFLGAGASVGSEGPAVLHDTVLADGASIASGYAHGAVLLRGAKLGANAHAREGTLLEEEASTAHAVGLKQTILLSFVTLGSLINFCDVLMAGGTSRRDHSEVGSGFIHFNFTPWGAHGDKATPSLVGDVVHGVLLDRPRIFLGGSGGMVGPRRVGYGSIVAAGQVLRRDVEDGRLVVDLPERLDGAVRVPGAGRVARVVPANAAFLGQLVALRAWYRQVRLGRADGELRMVLTEALNVIDTCIDERWNRLAALLKEHGRTPTRPSLDVEASCPLEIRPDGLDHVAWVKALDRGDADALRGWLSDAAGEATRLVADSAA